MWFFIKTEEELNTLAEKQFKDHNRYHDIVSALKYTKMEGWKILFNKKYYSDWDSYISPNYLFKWKEYCLIQGIFVEQNKILIPQIIKWFEKLWYKVLWMLQSWISVINKNWNKEEFTETETRKLLKDIEIPYNSFDFIYTDEFEKYL